MQAEPGSRADAGWLTDMTAMADSKANTETKISILI